MAEPHLHELWAIIEGFLQFARSHLRQVPEGSPLLSEFEEFLSHNELELALDSLAAAGDLAPQSARFWDGLIQAAKHMR